MPRRGGNVRAALNEALIVRLLEIREDCEERSWRDEMP